MTGSRNGKDHLHLLRGVENSESRGCIRVSHSWEVLNFVFRKYCILWKNRDCKLYS